MTQHHSRRFFLGALGASSLAPAMAAAVSFSPANVPYVSRELWQWMRAQLVLDPELVWLDTAGFGPTLRAVMAQEYRSRERQSLDFNRYQESALGFDAMRERLAAVAAFLGTGLEDLAFNGGTQEGLTTVARGLDLQPGDEILTTTHDHPAAVYPWLLEAKRSGLTLTQLPQDGVPVTPEAIVTRFAAAIGPRTKVMMFSHVQYTDGTVMPARELCALARSKGVFSVIDGAQAPGQIDTRIAELDCDAYATSFHKWLNAGAGTGALYLRRDARARLWPLTVERPTGWNAADRFGGTPPAPELPWDAWPEAQAKFGQGARLRRSGARGDRDRDRIPAGGQPRADRRTHPRVDDLPADENCGPRGRHNRHAHSCLTVGRHPLLHSPPSRPWRTRRGARCRGRRRPAARAAPGCGRRAAGEPPRLRRPRRDRPPDARAAAQALSLAARGPHKA